MHQHLMDMGAFIHPSSNLVVFEALSRHKSNHLVCLTRLVACKMLFLMYNVHMFR